MLILIKEKWQSYTQNEQRIIGVLLVLVLLVLLYALIWQPGLKARERLTVSIAKKQSQLQTMQTQAAQIDALNQTVKLLQRNPQGLKIAVETSARLHSIKLSNGKLSLTPEGALELTLVDISFDDWIRWADALQTEHQVRVTRCHIEAENSNPTNENKVKVLASLLAG